MLNSLSTLAPVIEALLRVMVGVALVPHGLRVTFGFFRGTGLPASNLKMLVAQLDRDGYRPGRLWAPLISATELVAGPLFALGLFTRIAAVPIVIFLVVSCWERWHTGCIRSIGCCSGVRDSPASLRAKRSNLPSLAHARAAEIASLRSQ
jgi:uncharacterized membrane protein YphA (DoxX/SURF4 family)